jgi:hypothetical protein
MNVSRKSITGPSPGLTKVNDSKHGSVTSGPGSSLSLSKQTSSSQRRPEGPTNLLRKGPLR